MECPRCSITMETTHTIKAGTDVARTRVCRRCDLTATTVEIIAFVNPKRGQGSRALARDLEEGKAEFGPRTNAPEQ